MQRSLRLRRILTVAFAAALAAALVTLPSAVAEEGGTKVPDTYLEHLSESVNVTYYVQHPSDAPKLFTHASRRRPGRAFAHDRALEPVLRQNANKDVFNCDFIGFPQNEESVGLLPDERPVRPRVDERLRRDPLRRQHDRLVLVDRRRPLGPQRGLPAAGDAERLAQPPEEPSGGDPVTFIPGGCDSLYAASLAYDPATAPVGAKRRRRLQDDARGSQRVRRLRRPDVLAGEARRRRVRRRRLQRQGVDVRRHAERRPLRLGHLDGVPQRRERAARLQRRPDQGGALRREPRHVHARDPDLAVRSVGAEDGPGRPVQRRHRRSGRPRVHHVGAASSASCPAPTARRASRRRSSSASAQRPLRARPCSGRCTPCTPRRTRSRSAASCTRTTSGSRRIRRAT